MISKARRQPATAAETAQPVVPPSATENHRVRVASERRDRMRERLIAATMDAFLHAEPGRMPVIDDVIRVAGVSRGTFYKYHESLDELLGEIGRQMAGEMLASFERMFGAVQDPAVCLAAGPLMAMARAVMEPRHAAFISHVDFVDYLGGEDPRSLIVARSLSTARQAGRLQFESLEAATDLVIGTSVEGARRLLKSRRMDAPYIREVAELLMLGLGLPREEAQRTVAAAWQLLQQNAAHMHWWQPVASV